MWNAIKSDLFDFVSTIQEDTTKTINKVLGDEVLEVILRIVFFLSNYNLFLGRRCSTSNTRKADRRFKTIL
jgi:hypothetical protein